LHEERCETVPNHKKLPKNPATKNNNEYNEKKKKFDIINRAVFIITPKREEKIVIRYLDKVLKSEEYAKCSSIPLHIIPTLSPMQINSHLGICRRNNRRPY